MVLKEVSEDLEYGKIFYDDREPGIGDYFYDSLIADIESLYIYAGVHSVISDFHRMFSIRFPYAIYYSIVAKVVYVAAVLPVRRDPAWLEKEIGKRH